jgi:hypothetical protein
LLPPTLFALELAAVAVLDAAVGVVTVEDVEVVEVAAAVAVEDPAVEDVAVEDPAVEDVVAGVTVVAAVSALWVTPTTAATVTPTPATAAPVAAIIARRMRRLPELFVFMAKTMPPGASGRPHPNVKPTSNKDVCQP